jgi:formate hydrogenlyase subunit 6/NADH:ubiquinone oxidoreductase subunit I
MGFIDLLLKPLAKSRSTVRYPRGPADSVRTARAPRFEPDLCSDDRACLAICPTAAIAIASLHDGRRSWALDHGKCIFCAECIRVCPSAAIAGTGEFELAAATRAGVISEHLLGSPAHD